MDVMANKVKFLYLFSMLKKTVYEWIIKLINCPSSRDNIAFHFRWKNTKLTITICIDFEGNYRQSNMKLNLIDN